MQGTCREHSGNIRRTLGTYRIEPPHKERVAFIRSVGFSRSSFVVIYSIIMSTVLYKCARCDYKRSSKRKDMEEVKGSYKCVE
jgi:hypothetical protein